MRRLVATDASFDALCHEYHTIIELLDRFEVEVERLTALEAEVKRLRQRQAWLEDELLTRIEGYRPR